MSLVSAILLLLTRILGKDDVVDGGAECGDPHGYLKPSRNLLDACRGKKLRIKYGLELTMPRLTRIQPAVGYGEKML